MLLRALAREKIVFGLDRELLSSLPARPDRYFHLLQIARGLPPRRGEDGRIVDRFPRTSERVFAADEKNQVDYAALGQAHSIRTGEVICQIVPPTEGLAGVTVRGEPAPAGSGAPVQAPKGRNTRLSEDGTSLVAAADGHVVFAGRYFEVRSTLEIDGDVDLTTGDLNYLGDIHIRGDVRSGFTVRALGSVTVDGVIEDTSVEAGGDLIVGQGVQGNSKAVLRAHRNVYAKYLESCRLYIQGDLYSDCIISCSVYCDGSIHAATGRGVIIGGTLRAGGSVRANIIGARTELQTRIILGGRPYGDYERDQVLQELQQMEEARRQAERQPESPEKQQQMANLRLQAAVSRMKLEKRVQGRGPETASREKRLFAGTVYPGTVISLDGCARSVSQETHGCTAALRDGNVCFL